MNSRMYVCPIPAANQIYIQRENIFQDDLFDLSDIGSESFTLKVTTDNNNTM